MLEEQLQALLELYGDKITQDMRTKMAEDRTVDSGSANASLTYTATGSSLSILGASYIEQIDMGRRPGKGAPPENLKGWIQRKGIRPNMPSIREKDLPYLINRAIKNKGTIKRFGYQGTNLFTYVVNKNIGPLSNDVADTVLEVVGKQLDTVIEANFRSRLGTPR